MAGSSIQVADLFTGVRVRRETFLRGVAVGRRQPWRLGDLFALRSPLDSAYVAEIDQQRAAARAEGGIAIHGNSAITVIGCRPIVKQDHGDELLIVRVMKWVNMPAMVPAILGTGVVLALVGQPPYCTESWIQAAVFLSFSSAQWFFLGALAARLVTRLGGPGAQSPPS